MLICKSGSIRWRKQNRSTPPLEGLRFGIIDETSLRQRLRAIGILPSALAKLAYRSGRQCHPALEIAADEVARCSARFQPDVVVVFGIQADFLAQVWPKALLLHVESGTYSRNPYPFSMYFDHLGMYGHSIVGRAGHRLRAGDASADKRRFVSAFRNNFATRFRPSIRSGSTTCARDFGAFVCCRCRSRTIIPFDEQAPYRTQFEFLHDVLSAMPRDVGVVVTDISKPITSSKRAAWAKT